MSRLSLSMSLSVSSPITASCGVLLLLVGGMTSSHADSMSALIAQKSAESDLSARYTPSYSAVPSAKISTRSRIQRADSYRADPAATAPVRRTAYRYPEHAYQAPSVLPAFLSGSYDNVDSEYLPILSSAERQSSMAAREVISTARKICLLYTSPSPRDS